MPHPIFVHIPKTAGSTLRTLITANYAPHQILNLYGDPKDILATAATHIGKTADYQLIQGHTPYGTHRFLGLRKARYFTFLREPIARFLSDIAHTVRHKNHHFHAILAAPGLSRDERISKALGINYYRNNMTQFVSGSFTTEVISLPQLGLAIDNLWDSDFVGITEHFDVSLLIMAKKLGWKTIIPQKSNVRPDQEAPVTPERRAGLERALAYDRMLYAVGQEHLAKSRMLHGPLLEEAAAQMAELIQKQDTEHPNVQFALYLVGDMVRVPLEQYHTRIEQRSPLHRWLHE